MRQPRAGAGARKAASGATATGSLTACSSGKSPIESKEADCHPDLMQASTLVF
jgi:hypothetical protein